MRIERAILIAFLGNYLINNVVGAIVALLPLGTAGSTTQYTAYIVLAALAAGIFAYWFLSGNKAHALKCGAIFGVVAFLTAVVTAFVSGIAGVLTQTGSFAQLMSVLPNFVPFFMNWSTLALFGYWIIPAVLVGWVVSMGAPKAPMAPSPMTAPRPMI